MAVKITEPNSTYGSNDESVKDTIPISNNTFNTRHRTLENNSMVKEVTLSEESELHLLEAF